jgi:hypothetical protein
MTENNENIQNANDGSVNVSVDIDKDWLKYKVNEQTKSLQDEIDRLKLEAKMGKSAPVGGTTATLNQYQVNNPDDIDQIYPDIPVENWSSNDENKLAKAVDEACEGKYGEDRKKEAIAVTRELRQKTDAVARIRGLEWELDNENVRSPYKFNGIGKPATFIPKDKRVKPKMMPVKKGVEQ